MKKEGEYFITGKDYIRCPDDYKEYIESVVGAQSERIGDKVPRDRVENTITSGLIRRWYKIKVWPDGKDELVELVLTPTGKAMKVMAVLLPFRKFA